MLGVVPVRVQAVRLPCLGVGIDVQPDGFIINLGTDNVVMEGFLPDGVVEVFGYAALSLLDDVGNRRGAHYAPVAVDQKQQMHMVGITAYFSRCTVGYLSGICKIACSTTFPIAESSGQGDGRAMRAPTAWEFCRNRVGSFQNKCTLPCLISAQSFQTGC